jgi:hypothetical protein
MISTQLNSLSPFGEIVPLFLFIEYNTKKGDKVADALFFQTSRS